MRVIGGRFRRRLLASVDGVSTRPMLGRLRQRLFDILQGQIEGRVFADLYAGTGAVGIEALSRGADRAVFVESNPRAVRVIWRNLETLGVRHQAQVRTAAVLRVLRRIQADVFFLGPPYEERLEYEKTLRVLSLRSADWVIAQHGRELELADRYGTLHKIRVIHVGRNRLSMFRQTNLGEPDGGGVAS